MKVKKKSIITTASIVFASAVIVIPTTFYFTSGNIPAAYDKGRYILRENKPLSIDGYFFDSSMSYGSTKTKTHTTLLNANLIREETIGETTFEPQPDGSLRVTNPSYYRNKLELAASIIIGYKENTRDLKEKYVVFDSDDAEIAPPLNDEDKDIVVALSSKNQRSINSLRFKNLVGSKKLDGKSVKITSINFTTKDLSWVDSNGEIAKNSDGNPYLVQPEDFYYSYMRTNLFDYVYRSGPAGHGGTPELDKYFIDVSKTITRLSEKQRYPNAYLFNNFGASSSKLMNESEAVRNIEAEEGKNEKVFSILSINDEGMLKPDNVINKILLNSNLLAAAPSQFIKEKYAIPEMANTPVGLITDEALKFGVYTYGITRKDVLYASEYIPTSASDNRMIFSQNSEFTNKITNNKNAGDLYDFGTEYERTKEIIFEYTTGINESTYQDQVFNSFNNKSLSEIEFETLSSDQQKQIWGKNGEEYEKNGLLFTKEENKTSLVQRTMLVTNPQQCTNKDHYPNGIVEPGKHIMQPNENPYYFNEEYAQFMFGSSIEDLLNGTAQTANSYFSLSGKGFQLRSLINAAINWYSFIQETSNGSKVFWINHAAPYAIFDVNDDRTALDTYETSNSIGFVKGDGTIQYITPQELKDHWALNQNDKAKVLKSPYYEEIKELVKQLLDDGEVTLSSPLVWQIIYPQSDNNASATRSLKFLIDNVIKPLDSRLQPKLFVPKDRTEMTLAITQNIAIQDFQGWGYDYEGFGTFLDGISHGDGVSLIGLIGEFADPTSSIELINKFPNFAELVEHLKKYFSNSKFDEIYNQNQNLKIENWNKLTNFENIEINSIFLELSNQTISFYTEIAIAFLKFQADFATKYNPNSPSNFPSGMGFDYLLRELNVLQGASIEVDSSINDPDSNGLILVQEPYLYPTINNGVFYMQDIKIVKKGNK